jgi:hypothetical protein
MQQRLAAANKKPPPPSDPEPPAAPSPEPVPQRAPRDSTVGQMPSSDTYRANKAHIGAWLHRDFKRSLLLLRAQTGEEVQTIIARALNAEFRAHNVPVVEG